jgi:hypothetical protein
MAQNVNADRTCKNIQKCPKVILFSQNMHWAAKTDMTMGSNFLTQPNPPKSKNFYPTQPNPTRPTGTVCEHQPE